MTPQQIRDEALREKVATAIGEASMCWEFPYDGGIFDSTNAKRICDELCQWLLSQQGGELTFADYEEVLEDHRRIAREMDIALNGVDGAAKQASLIDILAQLQSPQQGEGKEIGYVKGLVSALKIADKVLRKAESEMEGLDLTINEKELLIQIMDAIENISYALNQPPPQPKPEKTAEEILEKHILRKNLARVYTNEDVIVAMKEYASQSSSSLRDALEKLVDRYWVLLYFDFIRRGMKEKEATKEANKDELYTQAKALLTANNTQDKKEE